MNDRSFDFVLTFAAIIWLIDKFIMKPSRSRKRNRTENIKFPKPIEFNVPFITGYQRAQLLTERERIAYFQLKEIANEKDLIICPKVRLLDIVEPKSGQGNYKALLSKVMSKHVDFLVCTPDMQVFAIVELDDSTHLRPDRVKRDAFVDDVLNSVGYPIIHTYAITTDIFDNLKHI